MRSTSLAKTCRESHPSNVCEATGKPFRAALLLFFCSALLGSLWFSAPSGIVLE